MPVQRMIIGLSGKIGTGKSTLADLIMARSHGWARVSFADALKEECARKFGFETGFAYSQAGKARVVNIHPTALPWLGVGEGYFADRVGNGLGELIPVTVREILQLRGEAARRKRPNYWVELFDTSTRHLPRLICDDVRYPSEADYLRKRGAFLVRLEPYDAWKPGPGAGHNSETALDNYHGWDLTLAPAYGQIHTAADLILDLTTALPG
jgi:hypothetical protein